MTAPLLRVHNLVKHFSTGRGFFKKAAGVVRAVNDVSFDILPGETLGLVGESGCGKTTTGRVILRLIERTGGNMTFRIDGRAIDLGKLHGEELRQFRRHMQLIFQDPYASLNPRLTCMDIISEPLRAQGYSRKEIRERVQEVTDEVRLNFDYLVRYPHAFSGGQRQRIGIARALALRPELVICDEPVSALDVSVQAQILNLLMELQEKHGLTYLFIAHDLSVVKHISHRIAVMYAGRIVEMAGAKELFEHHRHPYTGALMEAVPEPVPHAKRRRSLLPGEVADPSQLPEGCAFHPRCSYCVEQCKKIIPELRDVGGGHLVACHRDGALSDRPATLT